MISSTSAPGPVGRFLRHPVDVSGGGCLISHIQSEASAGRRAGSTLMVVTCQARTSATRIRSQWGVSQPMGSDASPPADHGNVSCFLISKHINGTKIGFHAARCRANPHRCKPGSATDPKFSHLALRGFWWRFCGSSSQQPSKIGSWRPARDAALHAALRARVNCPVVRSLADVAGKRAPLGRSQLLHRALQAPCLRLSLSRRDFPTVRRPRRDSNARHPL